MKKNVGLIDRAIRIGVAAFLGYLIVSKTLVGIPAIVAGIAALVLVAVVVTGICPLFTVFGISTCKTK